MVTVKTLYAIYSKSKKQFKGKASYLWSNYPIQTYKTKNLALSAMKKSFGAVEYYSNLNTEWGLERAKHIKNMLDELDLAIIELSVQWEEP